MKKEIKLPTKEDWKKFKEYEKRIKLELLLNDPKKDINDKKKFKKS